MGSQGPVTVRPVLGPHWVSLDLVIPEVLRGLEEVLGLPLSDLVPKGHRSDGISPEPSTGTRSRGLPGPGRPHPTTQGRVLTTMTRHRVNTGATLLPADLESRPRNPRRTVTCRNSVDTTKRRSRHHNTRRSPPPTDGPCPPGRVSTGDGRRRGGRDDGRTDITKNGVTTKRTVDVQPREDTWPETRRPRPHKCHEETSLRQKS